jgi:fructose transport system ATP-binding protein
VSGVSGDAPAAAAPVLEARGLVKRYGSVTALDGADFLLRGGEILAVVGDNGAGKSTLIRALSGALAPDAGELRLAGRPVRFRGPLDARHAGIETVYQDLAVAPAMTVAENLFLGREPRRPGALGTVLRMVDRPRMVREAARHLAALGVAVRAAGQRSRRSRAGSAGGGRGARGRLRAPRGDHGRAHGGARRARARHGGRPHPPRARRGLAVVLISHDMPQVFELADRIHVARLGRRAAVLDPRRVTMSDVVAVMTGAVRADELPAEALAG